MRAGVVAVAFLAAAGCRIGYPIEEAGGGDGGGSGGDGGAGGSAYAAEVLADGPLAYWRLGEEVTPVARDASGNGHDGTYAVVTLGHEGAIAGDPDTAVRIAQDSQSGVSVAPSFSFAGVAPFSAEFWFQPEQSDGCVLGQADYDEDNQRYIGWFFFHDSGILRLRRDGLNVAVEHSTTSWTHIVATYDGVTISLYVDGELAEQRAASSDLDPVEQPFIIGRMVNWKSYEGLIDEIALYDYALPPARVAAHYAAATGG